LDPSVFIHEASHFVANGGSKLFIYSAMVLAKLISSPKALDYVYGIAKTKTLAKEHPEQAVMNADTYRYFAEKMWTITGIF